MVRARRRHPCARYGCSAGMSLLGPRYLAVLGGAFVVLWCGGCSNPAAGGGLNQPPTPVSVVTDEFFTPLPQMQTAVLSDGTRTGQPLATIAAQQVGTPRRGVLTRTPSSTLSFRRILTLANAEQGIVLRVGERFLLDLGERDWKVWIGDESILKQVQDPDTPPGSQGYFQALKPGQTVINATFEPPCRNVTPPCLMPALFLQIPVTVRE